MCEAALLRAEGRAEEASAAVDRALAASGSAPGGLPGWLLFHTLEAAATVDDEEEVRTLLAKVAEVAPLKVPPSFRAQQARFRARLPEYDAEAELTAAERVFRELGTPFSAAETQLELAQHFEASGRSA